MDPLIFYFDRNAGKRLPEALSLLKPKQVFKVFHHHTDRKLIGMRIIGRNRHLFKEDESDDKWLSFIGERGWIAFTQDEKFHKNGYEHELSAIKQFNVGCFYIWGASATVTDKAFVFLKALKAIIKAIETTQKPFIYKVSKNGKLKQIPIPK